MTRVSPSVAREILRLRLELGMSIREVASCCGVGLATAHATLERARATGITWPVAGLLDDAELGRRLYAASAPERATRKRLPDLEGAARARRSGKPLLASWREYRAANPEHDAYSYSHFCQMLKSWLRRSARAARFTANEAGRHHPLGDSRDRHREGVLRSRF